ncbi:hypothetical protein QEG98_06020 [Myxococcus sp. MxC21-1]|uniref:hypothetical protein n=1 Tax=Myxococcus sp. MxC21-1 TaxID=3041439 RepID=UPI00293147EC|nr:hypothetical protein [Myxococcus sp. MxC21-1]WNZ63308.1 hypothetical protein QEG98_06020 [Myxococcus sp. MxC21-1]
MSPGASALHALLRAWPDAPVRAAPEGAEADGLVHTAVGHGLVGFVAHAVERAGWVLPEPRVRPCAGKRWGTRRGRCA